MTPPAVFLDRDGTMIHDQGHLSRLDEVRWYPWTIDAVRLPTASYSFVLMPPIAFFVVARRFSLSYV